MAKIKFERSFDQNRSDRYQYFLVESSCSPDILSEYSDAKGIAKTLNEEEYNEELLQLKDELRNELWKMMEEVLTERQFEVVKLTAQGLTQMEIAEILNVNQSSVTKSLNGNCDYRNEKKRVYGGAKKKLVKAAEENEKIQEILAKMAELSEDGF